MARIKELETQLCLVEIVNTIEISNNLNVYLNDKPSEKSGSVARVCLGVKTYRRGNTKCMGTETNLSVFTFSKASDDVYRGDDK